MFTRNVTGPYSEIEVRSILRYYFTKQEKNALCTPHVRLFVTYCQQPHLSSDFMHLDTAVLEKLSNKHNFRENQRNERHSLLVRNINEFLSVMFNLSWEIWIKFGIQRIHVMQSVNCQFHENRFSENHTWLWFKWNFAHIFSIFCSTWKHFNVEHSMQCHKAVMSCVTICAVKNKTSFAHILYIFRLTCIKLGPEDEYKSLSSERFMKIGRQEAVLFYGRRWN